MARVWFILGLMVVILTVYTLVECAMFDRSRIRGLPRWVWLFVIVLIPVVGPLLWLIVGRGRRDGPGNRVARTFAPDDDTEFLKRLDRAKSQEERIRQLEQELADLDKPDQRGAAGTAGNGGSAGSTGSAGTPPKKTDPGEGDLPGRRDA